MKKDQAIQIAAELMDVLNRHGVDVDTPYVFENLFQDHISNGVISRVLVGDGLEGSDGDYDEYGKKPIAERIARYSKMPKVEDFKQALELLKPLTIQLDSFIKAFPETHPCREQTQFVDQSRKLIGRLVDDGVLDEEERV